MKKLLALLMVVVLCVSLCACNNGTELTTDNYTTYLNINITTLFTGEEWLMKPSESSDTIFCNSKAECKVDVSAASDNYDFEDTVITVKVSGTYDTLEDWDKTEDVAFCEEITITCNIGGNGSGNVVAFEGIDTEYQIIEDSIEYEYEVISISGTAVRVG